MKYYRTQGIKKLLIRTVFLSLSCLFSTAFYVDATTINVSSIATMQSAINSAKAGDEVVLANNTYLNSTLTIGTSNITVRAATSGGVYLNGTNAITISGNNVTLSGFQFTSGTITGNVISVTGSNNTITQLNFNGYSAQKYIVLNAPSQYNVVSYCNFENKPIGAAAGNLIHIDPSATVPGYHKIRYCSFQNMPGLGGDNGNECIRISNGATSTYISRTIVEFCYFNNTGMGDSEAISNKCRENVIRYNTCVNNPNAMFCFRNGDNCVAYGNFFIGAGGIRVKEANNIYCYNNYFENSGVGGTADAVTYIYYTANTTYVLNNINFIHNTFVECGLIDFDSGALTNTWANNIFKKTSGTIFTGSATGMSWAGNKYIGTLGISIPSGMTNTDPKLSKNAAGYYVPTGTSPAIDAASASYPAIMDIANIDDDPTLATDISGLLRPASAILKDVGCSEYTTGTATNHPLVLSEVGPTYLVAKSNQSITFPAIPSKAVGIADFDPGASASSSLQVAYTSSNTAVATIVNGQINVVGVGTTNITASQAGNAAFNAAVDVVQPLTVVLSQLNPNFADGTWGTVYSSNLTLGSFPTSSANGFDLTKAYIQTTSITGLKGEAFTHMLKLDKTANSGVLDFPTVASVSQLEIHAAATTGRMFTLSIWNAGTSAWNLYGTYTTTVSTESIFVLNFPSPLTNAKFRILNTSSGAFSFYKFKTYTTQPGTLATPTVGVANPVTGSTAQLNWTAVNNAIGGYKVYLYKGTTLQSGYPVNIAGLTSTSLEVSGLTPNTSTYNYKVQAIGNGDVDYSDSYLSAASTNFTTSNSFSITGTIASSTLTTLDASSAVTVASGGHLTVDAVTTVGSVTAAPGAKVTLANTKTLSATTFTLQSDASGTATFVDENAAGGLTVSGTINVKQYLTSGRNWYLSSPVTGATTSGINAVTGSSIVRYDEVHGTSAPWVTESATLTPGKGYIIASPVNSNPTITFTGTLNTGAKPVVLTRTAGQAKEGFNLIGNPYPSYVNWESATKTNVNSTLWYRTKNTSGTYVFDTFNAGVGTNNNLSGAVTGFIPPMQAVWAHVNDGFATGSVSFDNSMRSHATASTTALRVASIQQVLRLQVSNGINSDEAIVVFNADASNDFDAFDSRKMGNNDADIPEIFTMAGNEVLVINGLNNPLSEMSLGFRTAAQNQFTIKASEIDNFNGETRIILKDNALNIHVDLTDGTVYRFSSDVANTMNRFRILFKSAGTVTDLAANELANNCAVYVNADHQILVVNESSKNMTVSLYNLMGQIIENTILTGKATLLCTEMTSGVYFVRVHTDKNLTTVCKVKVD